MRTLGIIIISLVLGGGWLPAVEIWSHMVLLAHAAPAGTEARESPSEEIVAVPVCPVLVEYFYSPGCSECSEIKESILPVLTNQFTGLIELRELDINIPANYLRLAHLQERLKVRTSEPVSIVVDEARHLAGLAQIRAELNQTIIERLPTVEPTVPVKTLISVSPKATISASAKVVPEQHVEFSGDKPPGILANRLRAFNIPALMLAGLVDGLNPCAFATIIFFITLLTVSGRRGRDLLAVGIGFCFAVFATYFLLGYGVFHVIQQLTSYRIAGEVLHWGMIAALVVLAVFSFKDAWVFRRTGNARTVSLQLPDSIKRRIHGVMRINLTTRSLLAGSVVVGCLVTLLESVCTGQVYVPTLVYLSRYSESQQRAVGLLLVYNLMFVIPHVIIFVAARGITNVRLLAWSRSNVVWSKVIMGLFFVALALLLTWM